MTLLIMTLLTQHINPNHIFSFRQIKEVEENESYRNELLRVSKEEELYCMPKMKSKEADGLTVWPLVCL
jgi:hypothetical protein